MRLFNEARGDTRRADGWDGGSVSNRSKGAGQLVTMPIGLVGLGAGVAAALLFASVTSGSYLSIVLFYLAPLPIMIAGLGWSHWSALIAAVTASAAVAGIFGGVFFFAFLAGVGVPGWCLSYLTLLARPVPNSESRPDEPAFTWFPTGSLVVCAALLGAAVVLAAAPNFGLDGETFRAGLKSALTRMLHVETGTPDGDPLRMPGVSNVEHLLDFLVVIVPPAAAVLATVTNLVNLWLAARAVKVSSRLVRPWPQISAMSFPVWTPILLAVAVGLSFTGGLAAILAGVVTASLLIAYAVLGFAVLHRITLGIASRPFILGGIYVSVLVFGWPVLALTLLGLVETAVGVRERVAQKRGGTLGS